MKLHLHIGIEKTGSSFIQYLLADKRGYLREHNIHYPKGSNRSEKKAKSRQISPGNGAEILSALQNENFDKVGLLLDKYSAEANRFDCNSILISNENLIRPLSSKKTFNQFEDKCKERDIVISKILIVLRDPVEQLISLYKHRAKNGDYENITDWFEKGDYSIPIALSYFFNWTDSNAIGELIKVRKYNKDGGKLASIFFEDWLGVALPSLSFDQSVNPSLTYSELKLLRILRQYDNFKALDFYDRMLSIPIKEKADDVFMDRLVKKEATKHILKYYKEWESCNHRLQKEEKLLIPVKNLELSGNREIFSFSETQLQNIFASISYWNTIGFKLKKGIFYMKHYIKMILKNEK